MDGFWTAEFGSNVGIFGGGVVLLQDGRLLGGDNGYFYVGEYRIENGTLQATLEITPFIEGIESVFRTIGQKFVLDVKGTLITPQSVIAEGHPRNMPHLTLGVKLTKRL